jgi:hypothetical protein
MPRQPGGHTLRISQRNGVKMSSTKSANAQPTKPDKIYERQHQQKCSRTANSRFSSSNASAAAQSQ